MAEFTMNSIGKLLSGKGLSAISKRVKVPVKYTTNDGRLFAFLNARIASVKVDAPAAVRRGDYLKVSFSVLDAKGRPVEALLPAEIRLYDAAGREIDGAGWVSLQGGTCTVEFLTNLNDADGDYKVVCRDRASGLTAERTVKSPAFAKATAWQANH